MLTASIDVLGTVTATRCPGPYNVHLHAYPAPSTALVVVAAAEMGIDGIAVDSDYCNQQPWTSSPDQTLTMGPLGTRFGFPLPCDTDTHALDLRRRC